MLNISELSIQGLFGRTSVRVPIRNNRLIIVGYNGLGKSTILNILYYFISRQWTKLADQPFEKVAIQTGVGILSVSKDELHAHLRRRHLRRRLPSYVWDELNSLNEDERRLLANTTLASSALRSRFRAFADLPVHYIREIQYVLSRGGLSNQEELPDLSAVDAVDTKLTEQMDGRILYLPTYRRIEKDLKSIFPEIETDIQKAVGRRLSSSEKREVFVELVYFGMEDVKAKIDEKLGTLRSRALSAVSSLATRYLRDVIRNEARSYDPSLSERIDAQRLEGIFAKGATILSDDDRQMIFAVVTKIKEGLELTENEKYVAHYVASLVDVAERIQGYEKSVRVFVDTCNSYLFQKSFVFDSARYSVEIRFAGDGDRSDDGEGDEKGIKLEDLSSGEKQIVSLFSHLLLDDEAKNYIVIDEPELSLSVDWQQRLLSDISKLPSCSFIGAVTHSPFIFDNDLDGNSVDILSCME